MATIASGRCFAVKSTMGGIDATFEVAASTAKKFGGSNMDSVWHDLPLCERSSGLSLRAALMNLRPTKLRKLCQQHGLKSFGRLRQLVDRLVNLEAKSTSQQRSASSSSSTTAATPPSGDESAMWGSWDTAAIAEAWRHDPGCFRMRMDDSSDEDAASIHSLTELYGGVDCVSLHLELSAETSGLLAKKESVSVDDVCSAMSCLDVTGIGCAKQPLSADASMENGSIGLRLTISGYWPRGYDHKATPKAMLKSLATILVNNASQLAGDGLAHMTNTVQKLCKEGKGGRSNFHDHLAEQKRAGTPYKEALAGWRLLSSPSPKVRDAPRSPVTPSHMAPLQTAGYAKIFASSSRLVLPATAVSSDSPTKKVFLVTKR